MISNNKKHKGIKFRQINFKNATRFGKNNSTNEIVSMGTGNPSPKKKYNNSTKKLYEIDILNIIEKKMGKKNQNLVKMPNKKKSSNNVVNKFKNRLLRQKTFQQKEEIKIVDNKKSPLKRKPTKTSDKNSNFKFNKIKNKIKRSKTVCNNNYNKIANNQDNDQDTYCNNTEKKEKKQKKGKNGKKNKKSNKINEKENNKDDIKIKNNNKEIKEKRKSGDFLNIIKKKFLCCF